MLHRRSFVSGLALMAGSGLLLGRRAFALSIEEPSAKVQALYAARCSASGEHAALLAEAEASMQGRTLSAVEREAILSAVTCPICGCHPVDLSAAR